MTAAGSETKPTAEEASRPASAKAPSSRESLRHGTADAVVGGGGGGDDGDEAAHAFYARSVSDSYRLKSELVSRHLAEIGMGKFQWILFVVNGFGWCVDNFWSQGLTAARPPAGHEFFADGPAGGRLSFSSVAYYVGLMVGASFWSVSADLFGRKPAFNATLLLGGVFACAVAGAPSFAAFCALWALLGTAAGGNVPVDSIVFLEFVPRTHQWLLVTLSAWWNLGQIIVSLLAWVFLAHFACADGAATCARRDNMGWRYMMITLGAVALAFGLVRALLFRIPESPRYLLSKGRDADAVAAVNYIARYNGRPETLTLAMMQAIDGGPGGGGGGAEPPLPGEEEKATTTAAAAARLSYADMVRASFQDYKASHVRSLFAGRRMAQHTAVSFLVWLMIGVAYPLYFAFIPSYLEAHRADDGAGADASSLDYTYKVYCIVSACGIVGPLAAGFAVETRFGRRWMMAGSAVLTGVFLFAYTSVRTRASDIGFQVATAILGNFEYAIMFAFTPESFPGPVRGTGTGIAATLLRFGGLIASIASIYGGYTATPVYASAAIWILAGLACFGLPYETHGRASI